MTSDLHATPAKARIEESAMEVFARRGFADASVREIVAAAGVTKPVLYYYFKSKEHLYETLTLNRIDEFLADLRDCVLAPGSLRERLGNYAKAHFEYLGRHPMHARFMFGAILGIDAAAPRVDFTQRMNVFPELVLRVLREAGEKGEIPSGRVSETAANQFLGGVSVYILRCAMGFEDRPTPELAEEIVDLYLDGLLCRNGVVRDEPVS